MMERSCRVDSVPAIHDKSPRDTDMPVAMHYSVSRSRQQLVEYLLRSVFSRIKRPQIISRPSFASVYESLGGRWLIWLMNNPALR